MRQNNEEELHDPASSVLCEGDLHLLQPAEIVCVLVQEKETKSGDAGQTKTNCDNEPEPLDFGAVDQRPQGSVYVHPLHGTKHEDHREL